ncbi:MAG: hypothetical protein DHS20C15_24720 [Planctomycetota bacterium]|nr:MAG: hypothetical protein DHS20C15_24720 [Planctomycetota bacterium]
MNPLARTDRQRRQRGSTFLEVILATIVVGTTLVATTSSMSQSTQVYAFFADGPHEALMLAQEIREAAELLPWDAEPGAEATYGPDAVTLWDLDGASFKPPRSANYELVASHLKWTQDVSISFVDLENPNTVVDPASFEGETLVRLEVSIKRLSKEVDSFQWWLTDPAEDEG